MTLDLFRQDAWMLMPISWFVFVNVQVWLKDAARRDARGEERVRAARGRWGERVAATAGGQVVAAAAAAEVAALAAALAAAAAAPEPECPRGRRARGRL